MWRDLREFPTAFALMDEMVRQFDRPLRESGRGRSTRRGFARPGRQAGPRTNFVDLGETLVLTAEVPGLSEEEIEITATEKSLTVSGKRAVQTPEEHRVHARERAAFSFNRSYGLPAAVDLEKTVATVKNGILRIELPKRPEAQPKSIRINAPSA